MNNPTLTKVKTKSILMPLKHITLIILLLYPAISSCRDLFSEVSKHVYLFFRKG